MEAVKQGSATVGVKSKTHAVLVALKRASSELSAYQKKIMNLDDHMGMSIAGITLSMIYKQQRFWATSLKLEWLLILVA